MPMPAKATILYVEDNADNRKLVRRVLEVEGYEVIEAQDGMQAIQCLQSGPVDLALMDINMPEMDGYTLTARIRAMPQFAQLPIVAVTANVMRGDRERSLQAGCDGYIQKPIDIDMLSSQIERFLGARNTNA
jgi:two-component system cell cycle response regulator DivK